MTGDQTDLKTMIRAAIDAKTKPIGSLGRMEALAMQIALVQGSLTPRANTCRLTILAADHGIGTTGVSAYPQSVTREMVLNFLRGGAAANVFACTVGVDVQVVDAGVAGAPVDHPGLVSRRIAAGTENAVQAPAMTAEQRDAALDAGRDLGRDGDHDAACFGEMGIGNTSSASLVAAKILGTPVADLVGPGTGLDETGLDRKRATLARAADRTPTRLSANDALREYGGFEIAMMAGAMVGAAKAGKIVLVDGFIATVAALCAVHIDPASATSLVYAHRSAEPGHARALDALGAIPLLDLDMRLGEGTGALLAWPLVQAAAAILSDMASFDSANVSTAL